jgi:quercetin dioxygenase-like cupin family protein
MLTPDQVIWQAAPSSLPSGAQISVLYGDPAKEDQFALRLKFPKGFRAPPHSHLKPETVTVISGAYIVGTGETADPNKVIRLSAGGFFAFEPGDVRYAFVDEETVIQVNGVGPWVTNYINPADDPRKRH